MHLINYREQALRDVITKLKPELFKKVTGLTKGDSHLSDWQGLRVYHYRRLTDVLLTFAYYHLFDPELSDDVLKEARRAFIEDLGKNPSDSELYFSAKSTLDTIGHIQTDRPNGLYAATVARGHSGRISPTENSAALPPRLTRPSFTVAWMTPPRADA